MCKVTSIIGFLVRVGTYLDMLLVVPEASPPAEGIAGLAEVGEDSLYGSFSPHACPSPLPHPRVSVACEGEDTVEVKARVMLMMPELQEFCRKSTPPLSVVHLSLAASTMASTTPLVPVRVRMGSDPR
jgi:hypothetical protein